VFPVGVTTKDVLNTYHVDAPKVARPRHLREALGLAFVHRGKIRWHAGRSDFLGIDYSADGEGEGVIVDIADVADFREIRSDRHGLTIGAFANAEQVAAEPLIRSALGDAPFGPETARFRLTALDAGLIIAGMGTTRTARLDSLAAKPLPPNEIPLAITLAANVPKVSFGDRRIRRRDGAATFELRVFVALALAGVHRIATATVAYSLDGGPVLPLGEVTASLAGAMIGKGTFPNAARLAANAFSGDDEKTSVVRRTVIPLVLSALKDAYDISRPAETPKARRR
jgi:CO/xanthine dehydrogenase FAD-binding subunit